MVGPFKIAPGGLMHLLVAVDNFTKWVEAKPIKKLDGSSTIKFFNEIIVRYGVPHSIITDNGTKLRKRILRRILRPKRHPAGPGISGAPLVQRASGEGKWPDPSQHQAKTGRAS
jgi:hypothetical protein